ncbi:TPA: iron-dependent repressor [Enterococcus faecium]
MANLNLKFTKRKKKLKNNDLAKVLSVSPASVSEMLTKLRYEDYLDIGFQLTDKGKKFIDDYKKRF